MPERFPGEKYIMHRQDVLKDEFSEGPVHRRLLLCLNVFNFRYANENFEEFEANQLAVIVAILFIFFVIRGFKFNVLALWRKSLIVDLCLFAKIMERSLTNGRTNPALSNNLQKHAFYENEMMFDDLFARIHLILVLDELFDLPVLKVVFKAVFYPLDCVLFPIAKH